MITIISNKKLEEIKAGAFASGKLNGTAEVMECVMNTMLDVYDGSEHVFLGMISPIMAGLSSEGILSLTQAMELTSAFAEISSKENPRRKEKKNKKSKK